MNKLWIQTFYQNISSYDNASIYKLGNENVIFEFYVSKINSNFKTIGWSKNKYFKGHYSSLEYWCK